MRAIDADHLRRWILSRVFKTKLSIADVIDQIDREDTIETQRKYERREMSLDELLALTASMYDHLRAYKDILETGNCNNCMVRECKYQPQWGQMVRYNCPFYWNWRGEKNE